MSTAQERERIREIDHPGFLYTEWMVELVTDGGNRYGVPVQALSAQSGEEIAFTQANLGPLGTPFVLREAYMLRGANRIAEIPFTAGMLPLYVGWADSFTLAGIKLHLDSMSKHALGV